jgi:hypothetical protein
MFFSLYGTPEGYPAPRRRHADWNASKDDDGGELPQGWKIAEWVSADGVNVTR